MQCAELYLFVKNELLKRPRNKRGRDGDAGRTKMTKADSGKTTAIKKATTKKAVAENKK
jgi:hypothetical protein